MFETLLNWVADTFARNDVIDLYFVVSDLVDIPRSEDEIWQDRHFDAMAAHTANGRKGGGSNPYTGDDTPIGKTVI